MQGPRGCGRAKISGWTHGNACGCSNPVPAPTTSSEFRPPRYLVNRGDSTAPVNQYSRRGGNRNHGRPTSTPLSTTADCQQEKRENWAEKRWPPTRTLVVHVGPPALFKRLSVPKAKGGSMHLLLHIWPAQMLGGDRCGDSAARRYHSSIRTTAEICSHAIDGQDDEAPGPRGAKLRASRPKPSVTRSTGVPRSPTDQVR
jgi:hypothetical protein